MALGYLHNNTCFPTLADATAARWSEVPTGLTAGSTSYIADIQWSGTAWQVKKYTLASNGILTLNTTTNLPAISFPTCDTTETFFDGMALGWGVVGAMVAAFGIKFLARALNR